MVPVPTWRTCYWASGRTRRDQTIELQAKVCIRLLMMQRIPTNPLMNLSWVQFWDAGSQDRTDFKTTASTNIYG